MFSVAQLLGFQSMFARLLLLVPVLLSLVVCTEEADYEASELDGYRALWRGKEKERSGLMEDILRLKEEISKETRVIDKLTALEEKLTSFKESNEDFITKVRDRSKHDLASLNSLKQESASILETKKTRFLALEEVMWSSWDSEAFRHAFGFLLDKSLLTPQPQFPEIFKASSREKAIYDEALWRKGLYLRAESDMATELTESLGVVLKSAKEVDDAMTVMNKNLIGPLNGKLEMLKWRLASEKGDPKLIEIVEEHQQNIKTELEMQEHVICGERIERMKEQMENVLAEHPESRWHLRIGYMTMSSNSSTSNTTKSSFSLIPDHITLLAKAKYDAIEIQANLKQKAIDNDNAKRRLYAEMDSSEDGHDFLITKYAMFVEHVYKTLLGKLPIEQMPLTLYAETMNALLQ